MTVSTTLLPQSQLQFPQLQFPNIIDSSSSDESEFVAKFSSNPISIMSSKSGATHCTAPTVAMTTSEQSWTLGSSITSSSFNSSSASEAVESVSENDSLFRFSATASSPIANSPTSSVGRSRRDVAVNRQQSDAGYKSQEEENNYHEFETNFNEQASIETPLNMKPYVAHQEKRSPVQNLQPYVVASSSQQQSQQRQLPAQQSKQSAQQQSQSQPQPQPRGNQQLQQPIPSPPVQPAHQRHPKQTKRYLPRVTYASTPFEKLIAPTSYLQNELLKDDSYNHAMKCGIVWQSLVGQHVKFPLLWYDGEEPSRPYMGCSSKKSYMKWSFFGRHRITLGSSSSSTSSTNMLRTLVPTTNSSGKLLLHIIVIDSNTLQPTEDIVIGVFHPNAIGIRPLYTNNNTHNVADSQRLDGCRDIWIGHRSRSIPLNGRRNATRIESLLRHLNHSSVDKSPLGPKNESSGIPYNIDNTNMNSIYGRNPPKSTLFVPENKLYKLLMPSQSIQQQQSNQQSNHQLSRGRRAKRTTTQQQQQQQQPPASVILMKAFLR